MKLFKKQFYIIGERPQTDWRRVLAVAAIIAIIALIYGFTFYRQISANDRSMEETIVASETTNTTSTVQSNAVGEKLELGQTIELYSKKREQFEKMISELKKS